MRLLIITADDFGASTGISRGISAAVESGVVTTVSAMTTMRDSLRDLADLHARFPRVGIGVHLNICTGRPISEAREIPTLADPGGSFRVLRRLLPRIHLVSLDDLRREARAQVQALVAAGIPLDHLSYHNGVLSLYSPFFDVVVELAREYGVPVRSPVPASAAYPRLFGNAPARRKGASLAFRLGLAHPFRAASLLRYSSRAEMERNTRKLDANGIRHPDILIDCFWGRPTMESFQYVLRNLPIGTSELMVHLGNHERAGSYPSGLDLGYLDSRERELEVLTSPEAADGIRRLGIRQGTYSDLLPAGAQRPFP